MILRSVCIPLFLLLCAYPHSLGFTEVVCEDETEQLATREKVKPLSDLIASGEGDYSSANRGLAGDTPGGLVAVTGKTNDQLTVKEIVELQKSSIFAVGRYQFIPTTLLFALSRSCVEGEEYFTEEVQDELFVALLMYKRPNVGEYITGKHDDMESAVDDLAREFASVEFAGGSGYYDHIGNNRATISREKAASALLAVREKWQEKPPLP
jgi:hypothetical protein